MSLPRIVEPEWLDTLPPVDPRAQRSRRDLRLLNRIMGHAVILQRVLARQPLPGRTLAELGAGDGRLLLTLARRLDNAPLQAVLVDLQPCITPAVFDGFKSCGWTVEIVAADVFEWLDTAAPVDAMVCNLFLHHFDNAALARLFAACAAKTSLFVACEPARSRLSLGACRLLGLIGCNDVTRHDAAISVRAGFRDGEISALWPDTVNWQLEDKSAGLFSRLFVARRSGRD